MTKYLCNGDWLLEYADGELSAADSAQAELHLAACLGCSRQVTALRSSREMLSLYFTQTDRVRSVADLSQRAVSPSFWNTAALALASIAATALLVSILFFFFGQEKGEVVKVVPPQAELPVASPAAEKPEEDDVLAMISRETQIARLRMTSEILAKEPGMNERHVALEKYLTQAYGVTAKRQPFEM